MPNLAVGKHIPTKALHELTRGYIYRDETENVSCILGRGRHQSNVTPRTGKRLRRRMR
jgi:hypothetical protein